MTSSFCLRFSLAVFVGSVLLHTALVFWLGARPGLLLAAPSMVLAATTWAMRRPWIVWLALTAVSVVEACCVLAYLFAGADNGSIAVTAFAIAASVVQIPIAALVAAVRYFQNAD